MDRETFRIYHRHLSEEGWRDAYSRQSGSDPHDLDQEIWDEREQRNAYYDKMDN